MNKGTILDVVFFAGVAMIGYSIGGIAGAGVALMFTALVIAAVIA